MKETNQEVFQTIKNLLLKNVEQLKTCDNCGKIMYKGYNIDNERYYCSDECYKIALDDNYISQYGNEDGNTNDEYLAVCFLKARIPELNLDIQGYEDYYNENVKWNEIDDKRFDNFLDDIMGR